MTKWELIMEYILEHENELHLWYSMELQWCFISTPDGNRYKITPSCSLDEVREFVLNVVLKKTIHVRKYAHITTS
jgi:hypothetical protein